VKPFLLVLSSPSGGGKTTIARMLLQGRDDVGYSVSATTRPRRPKERDGVDYHFLSRAEFLRRAEAGEFLEHAVYNGGLYGTLRAEVERVLGSGRHVVLDIEVAGARQIRACFENSVLVYVLPPSVDVLIKRLRGRRTESDDGLHARLRTAAEELLAVSEYDYAVLNDDLVVAVEQVAAIIDSEIRRVDRQPDLSRFTDRLRRDLLAEIRREAGV
jgi:guanylate kinase